MLKIGCIGCGQLGKEHIKRLKNKILNADVVAICDIDEEKANTLAKELGIAKVYTNENDLIHDSEVEAVVCTTPSAYHIAPILEAIKVKKPIFVEKPLTDTAEDSKKIVDAEMACGKHLVQVGFNRRYDKSYEQVKELLDSGDYGSPLIIKSAHRASDISKFYPYYSTELQVTDAATHTIDILPWLIHDEIDEVQVLTTKSTRHVKSELQDPMVMTMKSKSGIICFLEEFHNTGYIGHHIKTEFICEDGIIELPQPQYPIVYKNCEKTTALDKDWAIRWLDTYDYEFQDWVNRAKDGTIQGASAWDGYVAAVTGDALLESIKTGTPVKVAVGTRPDFYK